MMFVTIFMDIGIAVVLGVTFYLGYKLGQRNGRKHL